MLLDKDGKLQQQQDSQPTNNSDSDPYAGPIGKLHPAAPAGKPQNLVSGIFPGMPAGARPPIFGADGRLTHEEKKRLKSMNKTMVFDVRSDIRIGKDNRVAFFSEVWAHSNNPGGKKTMILPLALSIRSLVNIMESALEFQMENWPQWAKIYYQEHSRCPKCGLFVGVEQKLNGKDLEEQDPFEYKDTCETKCGCGWKGIIDELVNAGPAGAQ